MYQYMCKRFSNDRLVYELFILLRELYYTDQSEYFKENEKVLNYINIFKEK